VKEKKYFEKKSQPFRWKIGVKENAIPPGMENSNTSHNPMMGPKKENINIIKARMALILLMSSTVFRSCVVLANFKPPELNFAQSFFIVDQV